MLQKQYKKSLQTFTKLLQFINNFPHLLYQGNFMNMIVCNKVMCSLLKLINRGKMI